MTLFYQISFITECPSDCTMIAIYTKPMIFVFSNNFILYTTLKPFVNVLYVYYIITLLFSNLL